MSSDASMKFVRVRGVMISTISVSPASSRLWMSARSVALSSPSSALVSTRVRSSSTCRMFSAAFSSPTMRVVSPSEAPRIAHTSGVTSLTHRVIGAATIRVDTATGAETAIV